jgi:hypothetical protein
MHNKYEDKKDIPGQEFLLKGSDLADYVVFKNPEGELECRDDYN